MKLFSVVSAAVLACSAAVAVGADIVPTDSFELYADQAALNAAWPVDTAGVTLVTDTGHTGTKFVQQPQTIARMYKDFPNTTPSDAMPLVLDYWIRTPDAANGGGRAFVGLGVGTSPVIEFGMYNDPGGPGFNARLVGGTPLPTGWTNVGGTRVSGEWTNLKVEVSSRNAVFYVNGVETATISRTASNFVALNRVYIGSKVTSTVAVDFDDVHVYTAVASVNDWSVY
jgi:hypothetical protein